MCLACEAPEVFLRLGTNPIDRLIVLSDQHSATRDLHSRERPIIPDYK
jgi:hypothetical protein